MDELTEKASTSARKRRKRFPKELADEVDTPGNIFVLSEEETKARLFHLRYSAKEDAYYRYSQEEPAVRGWNEGAFTVVNMQRFHAKGRDGGEWTYLTRKPRHSSGSISWFIDLGHSGLAVDQVYALTVSRTMSNGTISFDLRRPDGPSRAEQKNAAGSRNNGLIFVAYLDGGLRSHERAQTQLFFQDCLSDPEGFPFDLLITLMPSDHREHNTRCQTTNLGPPSPLSFPPKPRIVLDTPQRCTCLHNNQGEDFTKSASVNDFREDTGCYAQDEEDIMASEKPEHSRTEKPDNSRTEKPDDNRTEIRPANGVTNTCSVQTKDANGNGSVLLPGLYKPMQGVEATLGFAKRGKVTSNDCRSTERASGNESGLSRTEQHSEPSKSPDDGLRRSSEASTAWEHRRIDQENLVQRRRKSRCVIL